MPPTESKSEAPQTAMLLTQAEWDEATAVCEHYLGATKWADRADESTDYIERMKARRALCRRIIEANES